MLELKPLSLSIYSVPYTFLAHPHKVALSSVPFDNISTSNQSYQLEINMTPKAR